MSEQNTESGQNTNSDWWKRELGALWRREGRSQNYLSGHVKVGEFGVEKEVRLVVFTNKYKSENPKAPDFIVYEATDSQPQDTVEESTKVSDSSSDIPDMLEA